MKKIVCLIFIYFPLLCNAKNCLIASEFVHGILCNPTKYNADTTIPVCIKNLSHKRLQGIRSSTGEVRFRNELTLKNGKKIYAFIAQASIGCHINEPLAIKYYNDSCKWIATFYVSNTVNNRKKPFIAKGYFPEDFPEATKGAYPAYFEKEKLNSSNLLKDSISDVSSFFTNEKIFKIAAVKDSTFGFLKGDVISIFIKTGLKHFRAKKLINTYKIIPQTVIIKANKKKRVLYYVDTFGKLIDISNNVFLISTESFKYITTPALVIESNWQIAYELAQ